MEAIGLVLFLYVAVGFALVGGTLLWGLFKMTIPTAAYIAAVTGLVIFSGNKLGWDVMIGIGNGLMFFWFLSYPILVLAPLGVLKAFFGGERISTGSSSSSESANGAAQVVYADCNFGCHWNASGVLIPSPRCEWHNEE